MCKPQRYLSGFLQRYFVRLAQRAGWDHDQAYNGMLLPNNPALSSSLNLPEHNGSHGSYNDRVEDELDDLEALTQAHGWTDHQSHNALQQLAWRMSNDIRRQGGGGKVK